MGEVGGDLEQGFQSLSRSLQGSLAAKFAPAPVLANPPLHLQASRNSVDMRAILWEAERLRLPPEVW
jgi:hypothetical protein